MVSGQGCRPLHVFLALFEVVDDDLESLQSSEAVGIV